MKATTKKFPLLHMQQRPAVPTDEAAYYLGRKPETLRIWSCYGVGPLTPFKLNGRLMWRVADIRRLLGEE